MISDLCSGTCCVFLSCVIDIQLVEVRCHCYVTLLKAYILTSVKSDYANTSVGDKSVEEASHIYSLQMIVRESMNVWKSKWQQWNGLKKVDFSFFALLQPRKYCTAWFELASVLLMKLNVWTFQFCWYKLSIHRFIHMMSSSRLCGRCQQSFSNYASKDDILWAKALQFILSITIHVSPPLQVEVIYGGLSWLEKEKTSLKLDN